MFLRSDQIMPQSFVSADLFHSGTSATQARRQVSVAAPPITTTGLPIIFASSIAPTVADHRVQPGDGGMSIRLGHPSRSLSLIAN